MLQQTASDYFQTLSQLLLTIEAPGQQGASMSLEGGTEQAVRMILDAKKDSRKVLLAGNGGSSAIVSHVQNDLCKTVGVKAMVFTEQPLLIALANDDGFGSIYERPVRLWAQPEDLLIAVSSSGNSENILRAAQAAIEFGCKLVTFPGFERDNPLRKMGHGNFFGESVV